MQVPGLLVALLVTASTLAGCTSSPPANTANHAPQALHTAQLPAVQGRHVALDVSYHIRKVEDSDIEVLPFDREAPKHKGVLFEDARIQLRTDEQLGEFEQHLRTLIERSGGRIAEASAADLTLRATLTFGPTPAPAYGEKNLGKTLGVRIATLGLAPVNALSATADYELELTLLDGEQPLAASSHRVHRTADEMKSFFNFSQRAEMQQVAIELFRLTLGEVIESFARAGS